MRILYVIDSLGGGGAEQSTLALVPSLVERGHEVTVVTLQAAEPSRCEWLRERGVDVRSLAVGGLFGRVRQLRRWINAERPAIVHTSLYSADVVGRLAGWGTRSKVVSSFVNTPYDPARLHDPNLNPWKLLAVRLIDGVTGHLMVDQFHAVSEGAAAANARALRIRRSKVSVVHRGRSRDQLGEWSQERRNRARRALGVDGDIPLVLSVGRQEFQKAHVDLVRAVDRLLDDLSTVRVLLAGKEGNASTVLHAELNARPRAAEAITLLGHRNDVPDLLCAADVLAITSIFEGTAGVALEAMALRCPIVCTDIEGVRGVLAHGRNASLVAAGDERAMADALALALTRPPSLEQVLATSAAEFDQRYQIAGVALEMEHFYVAVAAGR